MEIPNDRFCRLTRRPESGKCGRGLDASLMKRQNFYDSFSEFHFFDRFGSEARRASAPA